jgi:hypothetical protein
MAGEEVELTCWAVEAGVVLQNPAEKMNIVSFVFSLVK